jgi:uncharacterized protein (TIGR02996 family)
MSGTEAGLLQSIADEPDDDSLRLIYTDWLVDHGQPERAEFIRIQIERTRLPLDDDRHADLAAREKELDLHRYTWMRAMPVGVLYGPWERGFPSTVGFVRGGWQQWALSREDLESLTEAVERWPIRTFSSPLLGCRSTRFLHSDRDRYPPRGESGLELLADWPLLRRLTTLEVGSATSGDETLGDFGPGLWALASSPHAENITRLILRGRLFAPDDLRDVGDSPSLPSLAELDLSYGFDDIVEESLGALAFTLAAARMRHLTCAWVDVQGSTVRTWLDRAPLTRLHVGVPEGPEGVGPLLGAAGLRRLRHLGLTGEEHGFNVDEVPYPDDHRAVPALLELLSSPLLAGLEELELRGIALDDAGALALADAPCARNLVHLSLDLCGLTGPGLAALRPLLAEGRLRYLSLEHNLFTDADALELASWPELGRLHELHLGYFNHIEEEAREALARSPHGHRWLQVS